MARKKDEELKDEALDADEASTETPDDDDLLPEAAATPARGGSGAFAAIVVVLVVLILAVVAYSAWKGKQDREAEKLAIERGFVGTGLGAAQANVIEAQKLLAADPPDIQGAIKELNDAASQVRDMTVLPGAVKTGLSEGLYQLQGEINEAVEALKARQTAYEETMAEAERELQTGAQADVQALPGRIGILQSSAVGDADTPLVAPGVSSVSEDEGEAQAPPEPAAEPAAEPADEPAAKPATEPATGTGTKTASP
jgi:uncharacterized protein HemX